MGLQVRCIGARERSGTSSLNPGQEKKRISGLELLIREVGGSVVYRQQICPCIYVSTHTETRLHETI